MKRNKVPKQVFTIKKTGQVIEIERNWMWRNIVVRLGEREIGHFKSLGPLKQGQLLKTPIGDVHIQYKQTLFSGSGFEVWYDNTLLSGSLNDPVRHWRTGYQVALFLAFVNIVLGIMAMASRNSFLTSMGAGPYSLVFGVALLLLGLWSWQKHSGVALGLAAFIFGADAVLTVVFLFIARDIPNVFPLMVRAGFVALMARGAGAAWDTEPEYEKVKNS